MRALLLSMLSFWCCLASCGDRNIGPPEHLQSECLACDETQVHLCLDGVDSDEDGLTDCDDPDCAGVSGCPWEGKEDTDERCADGLDNDQNGFTDCKDWSCSLTEACCPGGPQEENTNEACSNGIDDDCNGYVDCVDFACEDICQ